MIRNIIKSIDSFNSEEKKLLVSLVEDVYFYWDKFEILDDAIEIVHNFSKPKPISYYSPLSKFPRLDQAINYNAYVVAFINSTCFFETVKKREDDRFLKEFIQKCNANASILYRLKVELFHKNHLEITQDQEYFTESINEIEKILNIEIEKEYIKEIKKYRDKVLSHHTFFNESDINKTVSDSLMKAKKFLNTFVKNQLGEIITLKYHPRKESIANSVNLLRKVTKPNLEDIIQGKITFPLVENDKLKLVLADDVFVSMINRLTAYATTQEVNGAMVINFEIRKSFYSRTPESGIDTKFVAEAVWKLVKKYDIEGIKVNESIIDH